MSEIGHNQQPLTDDQRQALFFMSVRKIRAMKDAIAEQTADLRHAYKVAKADGFLKKDFDDFFALQEMTSEEVAEEQRRRARLAKWAGIGTQLDIEDFVDRRPVDERADEAGFRAGAEGEGGTVPSEFGAASQAWMAGWHRGADARRSLMEMRQAEDTVEDPFGESALLRTREAAE